MDYSFVACYPGNWLGDLPWPKKPMRAGFFPARIWKQLDRFRGDRKGIAAYLLSLGIHLDAQFIEGTDRDTLRHHPFYLSASYDFQERWITLEIYQAARQFKEMNDSNWSLFKFRLIQTLMHELVHMMQFDWAVESNYDERYLAFKAPDKERGANLARACETYAWAHCAYLEWRVSGLPWDRYVADARCRNSQVWYEWWSVYLDAQPPLRALIHSLYRWREFYEKLATA